MLFSHHVVAIGIAVIVAIGIMLKFRLEKSLSLALVTVVAIMEFQGDDFLTFGLIRFVTILVGVLAAFVVNLFFLPPKYEVKLFRKIYFYRMILSDGRDLLFARHLSTLLQKKH